MAQSPSLTHIGWGDRFGFRDLFSRRPTIEILEEEGRLVVKASLPGLKKEDLMLNLTGNVLTIQERRRAGSNRS
jgi:HSP20 family molecular chaperone IbpA